MNAIENLKNYKNIQLVGIHAHIGSQIFDVDPYIDDSRYNDESSKGNKR